MLPTISACIGPFARLTIKEYILPVTRAYDSILNPVQHLTMDEPLVTTEGNAPAESAQQPNQTEGPASQNVDNQRPVMRNQPEGSWAPPDIHNTHGATEPSLLVQYTTHDALPLSASPSESKLATMLATRNQAGSHYKHILPLADHPAANDDDAMTEVTPDSLGLAQLGNTLLWITCPKCKQKMFRNESTVFDQCRMMVNCYAKHLEKKPAGQAHMMQNEFFLHCVPCTSCSAMICMGCGRAWEYSTSLEEHQKQESTRPEGTVDPPCEIGRIVVLWTLLSTYEYISKPEPLGFSGPRAPVLELFKMTSKPGVGFEQTTDLFRPSQHMINAVANREMEVRRRDARLATYFRLLFLVFPHTQRPTIFNLSPPPVLSLILRRSTLLEGIAEMLRNDSIAEIVARANIYVCMLRVLLALKTHPSTADIVNGPRARFSESQSLLRATCTLWYTITDNEEPEPVQSLASLLITLSKTCETILRHATTFKFSYNSPKGLLTVRMCEAICYVAKPSPSAAAEANDEPGGAASESFSRQPDEPQSEAFLMAWHRENAVAEVEDHVVLTRHRYGPIATMMTAQNTRNGRMKRVIHEIAVLSSSLPGGIYVRHGSSRLDVMKVLIEGPKATPYEFGFFEFHVLVPPNYPLKPPLVNFAGQRATHINPNIDSTGGGTVLKFAPLPPFW